MYTNITETSISSINIKDEEYFSLTDIAVNFNEKSLVEKWLNKNKTKDFLAAWEKFNNPDFNSTAYEKLRREANSNQLNISPKEWSIGTNSTGIIFKSRTDGDEIYAHKDIAFEFGLWLSPAFKVFVLKEYHRLKDEENLEKSLACNLKELLAKIHFDINMLQDRESLIPPKITVEQMDFLYENEGDILNVAMFGMTAKQWHELNPAKSGCPKDFCTMEQLIIYTILESMDSKLINLGLSQSERLEFLNKHAITQMRAIVS